MFKQNKKVVVFLAIVIAVATQKAEARCKNSQFSEKNFKEAFQEELSLEKQNFVVDLWKIERAENEQDIKEWISAGKLVAVPYSNGYYFVDPRLDSKMRFTRPLVLSFVKEFSEKFHQETQAHKKSASPRKKIKLTSFVRHKKYQKDLARKNPNAIWDEEDSARQSSHLTGYTFDFSTKGMSRTEICWVKSYLFELQNLWLIHAREESNNNAFHVMVFPLPTFTGNVK